ncbi:pituitary tumor-transforming gene 1 protein-interacting protein-like isoform X2 [Liolophura sinensis]|uniref:pituitary tumor-transforming gene 1 protein-interacting protein-like isoform X2 n=1 Tax=Liolophura sinensis TaxID=3198878 RepID=UPI003158C06F
MMLGVVVGCFLLLITAESGLGQNDTTTTTSTTPPTSGGSSSVPTTTLSPQEECMQNNKSCADCLKFAHCLWCFQDNSCKQYPVGHILPRESDCPLDQARWGICSVNFKILIIAMSCVGGVIILLITSCCIYCCCCRSGKGKKRFMADEAKYERQKEERKRKSEERRSERKAKTDEIRRKYGLVKDNPYSRFDADA